MMLPNPERFWLVFRNNQYSAIMAGKFKKVTSTLVAKYSAISTVHLVIAIIVLISITSRLNEKMLHRGMYNNYL
ncbi:hypothetical protein NG42_01210 [Winslowiella iniecta]|uniref:Uncharacterized protein n=1 Tax=Winslowiella iniecta TaxID=1560201 RepID=A0A0L7TAL5_9GAMM|nr:hypothetical protein NG43_13765 [Winslowiella iniecta]KOC92414.1 hypothetical protein NG42_01210 [Winslowiella iniecta]